MQDSLNQKQDDALQTTEGYVLLMKCFAEPFQQFPLYL